MNAEQLYAMELHERLDGVLRVPGGWIYFIKDNPPVFVPLNNEFKPKQAPAKPKQVKPEEFKRFFDLYPETKKGGRDVSAWEKAKRLNLTSRDYSLMVENLTDRKEKTPEWYETYAPGICKYLDEAIWLTPIKREKEAVPEWSKIPKDDAKLESWASLHGFPAPSKGHTYHQYRQVLADNIERRHSNR